MTSLRLFKATAGQQIGALLVIVFILLAANVTASTWLSSQSEEFADRTLSEQQLKAVVLRFLNGMQDVETGMRGFLLTEDEAYLQPFRNGVASVPRELDVLQDLGRNDPFVSVEVREIAKLAEERVAVADMPELERAILHRLAELDALVRGAYMDYDFKRVTHTLSNFMNVDLSAFYFDIRKDTLYCDAPSSLRRRACRTVLDLSPIHL